MSGTRPYVRSQWLSARELGLNAVTLAASRTGSTLGCDGYTTLILWVNFTFSAETALNIAIDTQPVGDTTNWYESQIETFSAGSGDLENARHLENGGATKLFRLSVDIAGLNFRVRLLRTAGVADDTVTVRGLLTCR